MNQVASQAYLRTRLAIMSANLMGRERLQQLYGDNQAFTLAPNEPTGLRITINIPYEVEND